MFKSYIIIALRNLMRNKLYSLINIGGLALGMAVFVFATVLADYEKTHDVFFEKSDRIYSLGSIISPNANMQAKEVDSVYTRLAPHLKAELPDIEETARLVQDVYLLNVGENSFYQHIKFVDKELLKIFDFDYVAGDSSALDGSSGVVLTESMAKKYFPDGNAMGKVITLSFHEKADVRVTAIIRDIPKNSHFVASFKEGKQLEIMASLDILLQMSEVAPEGNWHSLSGGNYTYVLLPPHLDEKWLTAQADAVYQRHAPEDTKKFIERVHGRRLQDMNLALWDVVGWPVIEMVSILGFLVLVIAGLNYTNLATAQAFSRAKEVGLRKTMGANINQLLFQFLVESVATAVIAMIVALALLEIIIPTFNSHLGKVVTLDYMAYLPLLVGVTVLVGLVAGSYPAYVITRAKPIDALKNALVKGGRGSIVRSSMIGAQFVFSIFMLSMVAVVFFQNEKIKNNSNIFPKSQIVILQKAWVGDIPERHDVLKQEIAKIPGVEAMTYSSQVPFVQQNWTFRVAKQSGDLAGSMRLNRIHVEYDFLKTYDIPLVSGRDFSRDVALDSETVDSSVSNVVVNEMALERLGYSSAAAALGQTFHQIFEDNDSGEKRRAFVIVGVVADQNFLGLHNSIKPIVFRIFPKYYEEISIRIKGDKFSTVMPEIEKIWKRVNPNYPIQIEYLDAVFEKEFTMYRVINLAMGGFAMMALALAFIGLFGLAAFMAAGRTKEIGIRKVMGAETFQIVRLLIWQFSRPVLWALVFALPLSLIAADFYLNYFAERIEFPFLLIVGAGMLAVVMSWGVVSAHAYRVSCQKPIKALRYE